MLSALFEIAVTENLKIDQTDAYGEQPEAQESA
jgi:hypothetical protein